jgi:hypothetical protein
MVSFGVGLEGVIKLEWLMVHGYSSYLNGVLLVLL